jgi:hypothetical protein
METANLIAPIARRLPGSPDGEAFADMKNTGTGILTPPEPGTMA